MSTTSASDYVIPAFYFEVSWNSASLGCSEVKGLNMSVESMDYRTGEDPFHTEKLAGMMKFDDVVLRKGVFKSKKEYITWFEEVTKRTTEGFPRSSVTIILKDENKSAVITWNLKDAWASEFNMPDLNAKDNQPAFESIKIKYSSMEVTYA